MSELNELYQEKFVFICDAKTQSELFTDLGNYLYENNIVTEGFTQAVCEREKKYPTGIDLSVVEDSLPNVAIPHTDAKYCKTKAVVFVKLKQAIPFYHMIQPDESLAVRYLFLIINHTKDSQSTILSELMEFITNPKNIEHLETLNTEKELYGYLSHTQRMMHND